jgi:ADP-dependent NAD(P)H-hydrate dehydratase / NAD(P)H-hydrate epimerase
MKVFDANQVRNIDSYTIEHEPIESIDLMERAATKIYQWFAFNVSPQKEIFIFAGPGNNGGDGVALARMLAEVGYNVRVFILKTEIPFSPDLAVNIQRIQKQAIASIDYISSIDNMPAIPSSAIVVDALFGSGLSRPLEGVSVKLVESINSSNAQVVAIDIPSGLFANENPFPNRSSIVKVIFTLSLQFPKLCFFFPENSCFVGKWFVLPIGLHPTAIIETPSFYQFLTSEFVSNLVRKRLTFDHKGTYGHCLIVAGSYGMIGAAVLTSKACIKAGAGLVTAHVPRIGYNIIQQSVPEVMVSPDDNDGIITSVLNSKKYSSIAIGPGLGMDERTKAGVITFLRSSSKPLIIDADALNIISSNKDYINLIPANSIITPHPGEFDRLFGKSESGYERLNVAIEMAQKLEIVIVLKGAYTQIVSPTGNVFFNCTGNPGMATGGSGDVLTGMIASLLGQGYSPMDAAILGVHLHGLAGDLASEKMGLESITATDIIDSIGDAFIYIRNS